MKQYKKNMNTQFKTVVVVWLNEVTMTNVTSQVAIETKGT